ncbi:PLP-dependent transferase [Rhodoferax sp. PAMC 29310]|uniref:PLP-dependent transferase n=1 Tax=Rhodoferax sp. PAMC 29310 TaxID=2822760 RepID=UPI001B31A100|nr:PLP-dependent transferase [Rhodoferax sp. PAMC 29310]
MTDLTTTLIHHPYKPPEGFSSPQPGVFKASTVIFPSVAAMRDFEWKDKSAYTYGLHGTPTTYMLEERLCTLEGGLQCLLLPSGLAAIANVALSLLSTGDEVLIPDNAYGPNKTLAEGELLSWGISHQYYDPLDLKDLESKITDKTRLVWLEAAGSVTLEFPDLPAMVKLCHARGVLTALDNTWGAGLAFAPFDLQPGSTPPLGVDVSVHALTKYPSGGGDVLMGSVVTRNTALHMKLKLTHMRMGFGVGANDAEAVMRGLPSMKLRYHAHDESTRQLVAWAETRAEFSQVLHPSLTSSPGHAQWLALCGGEMGSAAGLFSVVIDERYTQVQVDKFCDSLLLFKVGYSWGGPMSLVVPYGLKSMRANWPSYIRRGTVVRFSIGLESANDLRVDLAQALAKALR